MRGRLLDHLRYSVIASSISCHLIEGFKYVQRKPDAQLALDVRHL